MAAIGRHVCVLDRGWIFVGDVDLNNDNFTLTNVKNIRVWTSGGFGGMITDPTAAGAVFDVSGDMKFRSPIFFIPVAADWDA